MVRHPPMQQSNGKLLLLAYEEKSRQTFLLSGTTPTRSWRIAGCIPGKHIQADAVCLGGPEWQLYFRPTEYPRFVHRSYSVDDGQSWSNPVQTVLPCPLSGIATGWLDGLVVVVHNHTLQHQRTPLSVSWSSDRGLN